MTLLKKYNLSVILTILFVIFTAQAHAQKLPKGFVYIKDKIPTIELELRYTGTENFMGRPVDGYVGYKCIVSKKAARALRRIQRKLKKHNLGLKIFDAYRPQKAVDHFVRWAKNVQDTIKKQAYYPHVKKENLFEEGYIAYQSGHTRGSTVDLTIIDKSDPDKKELDMGGSYDFFGIISWVSYDKLTHKQLNNRALLQSVMKKFSFNNYPKEWWHFTLKKEPFPNTYFNFLIE